MPTFGILAHTQPDLVVRLARRLAPHPVIVHWDAKSGDVGPQAIVRSGLSSRVDLIPSQERVAVNWGGFSMIEATLALYSRALAVTPPGDHIVLLSGQDYPIHPVENFTAYLQSAPHREHARMIEITPTLSPYYGQLTGTYLYDVRMERAGVPRLAARGVRRLWTDVARRFVRRRLPEGCRFGFGSQWVALTRECVDFVLSERDSPLLNFTRRSFAPDEKAIHSLIANSPFLRDTKAGGFESFEGSGTYRMANYHHIHPSLSKVYEARDLCEVIASGKYFLRKVSLPSSLELLNELDDIAEGVF